MSDTKLLRKRLEDAGIRIRYIHNDRGVRGEAVDAMTGATITLPSESCLGVNEDDVLRKIVPAAVKAERPKNAVELAGENELLKRRVAELEAARDSADKPQAKKTGGTRAKTDTAPKPESGTSD